MKISTKVSRVLDAEQISTETLEDMLNRAALTRVRGFNRRYFGWLFLVDDYLIADMQRAEMTQFGDGDSRMTEEHEQCGGKGCHACGWIGQITRRVKDKKTPTHQPIRLSRDLRLVV